MSAFWHTVFYQPLYNGLIFLIGIMPGFSVGLAVILLTVIVRLIIFPFVHKSIKTQRKMRELEPELKKIREKYKDKQEQAKRTMELYQKHGTNPFSGCLTIIIQLPILIALYLVFRNGFSENAGLLYSFVHYSSQASPEFLGLNLEAKSYLLALVVGVSQYFYTALSLPKTPRGQGPSSFQEELSRSMNLQMRYFFPILFVVFSATLPAAVALYWLTSNMFSIAQEFLVRALAKNEAAGSAAPPAAGVPESR